MVHPSGDTEKAAEVEINKDGQINWIQHNSYVDEVLAGDVFMLGGKFDPEKLEDWLAMPYIFHGQRFFAEVEGADPIYPEWHTKYMAEH